MRIATKLSDRAAGGNQLPGRIVSICAVAVSHQVWLFWFIAPRRSKDMPIPLYLIIVLDCIPNLCSCVSIIRGYRQVSDDAEIAQKQTDALQCLALKEIIEVLMPVAFTITYAMAYYGPNAELMTGVGNEYWCKHKVAEIEDTLSRLGMCFVVDVLRGISIGVVMWRFCKTNIVKLYGQVMKKFGFFLLVFFVVALNKVCVMLSVLALSSLITCIYQFIRLLIYFHLRQTP